MKIRNRSKYHQIILLPNGMPIIRAISAAYRSLMTLNVRIVRSKTIKSSHDWSYYWNNLIVIASLRTHTIIYFQPLLAIMIQSYHLVYFDKSCTLKKINIFFQASRKSVCLLWWYRTKNILFNNWYINQIFQKITSISGKNYSKLSYFIH